MIITLGEVIIGTVAVAQRASCTARRGGRVDAALLAVAGVGLTFGCWWMYFAVPWAEPLVRHRERGFAFGYGHLFVFGALAAIGGGLHVAAFALEGEAEIGATATVLSVAIPVAVYVFVVYGLYSLLMRERDPFHLGLLVGHRRGGRPVASCSPRPASSMAVCLLVAHARAGRDRGRLRDARPPPHRGGARAALEAGYVAHMIIRSPHGDVTVPDVTLPAYVLGDAEARGDKPALIDGPDRARADLRRPRARGARRSRPASPSAASAAATSLALCAPNTPEYAVAFHAVAALGGVVTTINPAYTAHEIALPARERGRPARGRGGRLRGARDARRARGRPRAGRRRRSTTCSTARPDAPMPDEADPDDLVALPYSSGTTGLPKGVMLTHRNVVANLCQVARGPAARARTTRSSACLPFFHIYGMTVIMNQALRRGATVVTMPRFDLDALPRARRAPPRDQGPPRPADRPGAGQAPARGRATTSRACAGSTRAPRRWAPSSRDACAERLGCLVVQGYGLTETSPVTHAVPVETRREPAGLDRPARSRAPSAASSTSRPGRTPAPGEDGEVWIRGPQVMRGYLGDEQSTADTLDADGWLHTGDIGHADEDGWFYSSTGSRS